MGRRMKRFVWPQYLVEPQYIKGYVEERVVVSIVFFLSDSLR